jgi:TatD DNase family protein
MRFFDIHTHINQNDSGIRSIINILPFAKLPSTPFSVGIHPWSVQENNMKEQLEEIEKKVSDRNCAAVGECGLDRGHFRKSIDADGKNKETALRENFELQSALFKNQVKIANSANKPMIIHCTKALPELLSIRKSIPHSTPWIIHGFRGSKEIAESLIQKGIYLSFGRVLCSENAYDIKTKNLFRKIPSESIFLETDNVEQVTLDIRKVYAAAAQIRGITILNMQNIIHQNMKKTGMLNIL